MNRLLFILWFAAVLSGGMAYAQSEHDERGFAGPQPTRGRFYYVIQDVTADRIVARGVQVTDGDIHQGLLLPASHRFREGLLHARTLKFGFSEFVTPAAGVSFTFPDTAFTDSSELFPDADGDGLSDVAEFIVGSDPQRTDTDSDGINDAAEIRAGESPVAATESVLGIVAGADTPGTAVDVAADEGWVVVADDAGGLAIFRANPPGNPILIDRFSTNGSVRSVVISEGMVLATTQSGLLMVELGADGSLGARAFVSISGARAATRLGNVAFVGTGSQIIRVDINERTVSGETGAGGRVDDLAARNGILYATAGGSLRTFRIFPDVLESLDSAPLTFALAEGITGRHRLSLGVDDAFATSYPGFDRFLISDPADLRLIGPARDVRPNSFKQIVPTGSGIGVAASGVVPRDDGTHDIWLYSLTTTTDTTNLLAVLETPGIAHAVAIYNGLAYVADGVAGLQVINYLEADRSGFAPNIALQTSFPLQNPTNGVAEAGSSATITAVVTDDVAVRSVRFFINGTLVSTDGNFPFEHRFNFPNATGSETIVHAVALDGAGSSTESDRITVEIVADATPPRFVRGAPRAGELLPEFISASASFSEPLDSATISEATVQLRSAGQDRTFGNADDSSVTGTSLVFDAATRILTVRAGAPLPFGLYRLELTTGLKDLAGLPLERAASIEFRVVDLLTDADGDALPNDVELLLGLDPSRPDTNGNGVPDGREDTDNDGLRNQDEAPFGFNPGFRDTDGNGIPDGDEDIDRDGLATRRELDAGTDPRLFDTDNDGWPDEGELTGGSDPLLATSRPFLRVNATPMVEVIAARSVSAGLTFGVTSASVPVEVIAPRAAFSGIRFGVTVAAVPVEVIAPRAVFGGFGFGPTLALPPVEIIAPRAVFDGTAGFGITLGQPPLEIKIGP